jgi:hypothetical protein
MLHNRAQEEALGMGRCKYYYLQKMDTFDPDEKRLRISGWMFSEKFDGRSIYWDGGISRGDIRSAVPYANNKGPQARQRGLLEPCTGLWSSNGNVLHAPSWWLDMLPPRIHVVAELLHTEIAGKPGQQKVMSASSKITPVHHEWDHMTFKVYDIPTAMFMSRKIDTERVTLKIDEAECLKYVAGRLEPWCTVQTLAFASLYEFIQDKVPNIVKQRRLPLNEKEARATMREWCDEIIADGGEGAVFRDPHQIWWPSRVKYARKEKSVNDAEAIITGWTDGKDKYEGMLGAVVCEYDGPMGLVELELSGMDDDKREMTENGEPVHYKVGDIITFAYRTHSAEGIPIEARIIGMRGDEA